MSPDPGSHCLQSLGRKLANSQEQPRTARPSPQNARCSEYTARGQPAHGTTKSHCREGRLRKEQRSLRNEASAQQAFYKVKKAPEPGQGAPGGARPTGSAVAFASHDSLSHSGHSLSLTEAADAPQIHLHVTTCSRAQPTGEC